MVLVKNIALQQLVLYSDTIEVGSRFHSVDFILDKTAPVQLQRPRYQRHIIHCKMLTHWGRVTHICVSKLTIIGSDNGLSPGRHQAIIRTNAGILLIGRLGTNLSEISIEIHTFSFKKMHLKMSSARCRPFCLGFSVLTLSTPQFASYTDCKVRSIGSINSLKCLSIIW